MIEMNEMSRQEEPSSRWTCWKRMPGAPWEAAYQFTPREELPPDGLRTMDCHGNLQYLLPAGLHPDDFPDDTGAFWGCEGTVWTSEEILEN